MIVEDVLLNLDLRDQLSAKAKKARAQLNELSSAFNFSRRLEGAGLAMNKQGQVIDRLNGKFVSLQDTFHRLRGAEAAQKQIVQQTKDMAQVNSKFTQSITTPFSKAVKDYQFVSEVADFNVGQVFRMSHEELGRFVDLGGKFNTRSAQMASGVRRLFLGMQGFRMEMLSVMFFGMGMAAMFKGFLNPALQVAGVFEVLTATLQILFLPIALWILENIMLPMMDFFTNLSPQMQMAIGAFVAIGVVVGTLVAVFGALFLGIGGIVAMFTGPFAVVGTGVLAVLGPIAAIIGILIALVALFAVMWVNNFANIREWSSIFFEAWMTAFKGIANVIMGFIDIFKAVFRGDFKGVVEGVKRILTGLRQIFIDGLLRMWLALIGWMGDVVVQVAKWGVQFHKGLVTVFKDAVAAAFDFGVGIVNAIVDGVKSVGRRIGETILGFMPSSVRKIVGKLGVGGKVEDVNDFILQPGGRLIRTDPQDTIVGTKNGSPGGNSFGDIVVNVNGPAFDHRRLVELIKSELRNEIRNVTRG